MNIVSTFEFKDRKRILQDLGLDELGEVQAYFTNTCARYMDKYVPYADGSGYHLRDYTLGHDYIEYNFPYAHYMYEGELYVDPDTGSSWAKKDARKVPTGKSLTYHTPGTGAHWDSLMWTAEGYEVVKKVQQYVEGKK